MGNVPRDIDDYLLRAIYAYAAPRIDAQNNFMYPALVAKYPQYSQEEIRDALELLIEKQILANVNHLRIGPGKQFLKWREEMSTKTTTPSPMINIGTINGPTHLGQGDINITNNDAEALIKLVQELSKSTENKPLGDKISGFLSTSLGVGSNATTILQGLAQLGASLL